MTRRRLLRFLGLPAVRFAPFVLLAAAIIVSAALFLRATFLVGFAIGFRLPLGLRLTRRFRAFLRLGPRRFVACSRFGLASMPLARIAFRPFAIVPFTRFTCFSIRTIARLAFSRL